MLHKRARLAGFLLLAAFAIQHGANASLVTVLNPSFEAPDPGDGGFTPAITNWVIDVAGSGAGVFDPVPTQITPTNGAQVAYANPLAVFSQVLSTTLSANTLYTLLVDVGDRIDLTFGGYTVNLYAGATLIGSDTNTLSPNGGFLTSSIVYPSLGGPNPLFGQALKIELKYGPGNGTQTVFDNVRLDATSTVPELSSVAVWSVLSLAVAGGAKRHRRKAALK